MKNIVIYAPIVIAALTVACSSNNSQVADGGVDSGVSFCEDGTVALAFQDIESQSSLRAIAAYFEVETTEGAWRLSSNWNGCDSYLLILDSPSQNSGDFGYDYWEDPEDVAQLLANSPANVHYLFMSKQADEEDRLVILDDLRSLVETALSQIPAEDAENLKDSIHYVTEKATAIDGWVGEMMTSPGFGFGIDRFQRIRFIGSYADQAHYNAAVSWPFGPNIAMAANEAIYYNYEALRENRLAAQEAQVFTLWENVAVASLDPEDPYTTVLFPAAAEMKTFDTMELDFATYCGGIGEFGKCPEWDYNVFLYLCDQIDTDICDTEIGHWITTYHREGRWVHDVSGLLPLLENGGERRFRIAIDDSWYVSLSIRLYNRGKQLVPVTAYELFTGDDHFGPDYNDNYSPMNISIPADAVKVELATAITGHGMQSPGNCAEFCNHTHHFYVNGIENILDNPIAGNPYGCMEQIADGTVPNQYGTWWYGRGGWCPGKQVDFKLVDITDQVTPGAENTFDYDGFYNGTDYPATDGWQYIHLSSWVIVSK